MAGSYRGWNAHVDAYAASSWVGTKEFRAVLNSLQGKNFGLNTDREDGLRIMRELVSEPVFGPRLRFPDNFFYVCVDDINVECVLQQIKTALEYKDYAKVTKVRGIYVIRNTRAYNYGAAQFAYRRGLSSLNADLLSGVISYDRDNLENKLGIIWCDP